MPCNVHSPHHSTIFCTGALWATCQPMRQLKAILNRSFKSPTCMLGASFANTLQVSLNSVFFLLNWLPFKGIEPNLSCYLHIDRMGRREGFILVFALGWCNEIDWNSNSALQLFVPSPYKLHHQLKLTVTGIPKCNRLSEYIFRVDSQ